MTRARPKPGRSLARARACASLFAALAAPAPAAADGLALVDAEPLLVDAVEVALAPWGVEVARLASAPDETSRSGAERGRALASRSDAAVLVWLEASPGGTTLWVYQPAAHAAIGQELSSSLPFDAPTAAAVALSLKTLLRHSPLDPAAPAPPVVAHIDEPAATPAAAAEAARAPPPFSLELAVGPRFFGTRPDHAELALALGAGYWPAALGRHLGVVLRAASGPGVEVDAALFDGRLVELRADLGLEARFWPVPGLELGAGAGLGARVGNLSGAVEPGQRAVSIWRASPMVSAELRIGARLAPEVFVGLRAGVDVPLLRQRYLVRGEPVLTLGEVALYTLAAVQLGFGEGRRSGPRHGRLPRRR